MATRRLLEEQIAAVVVPERGEKNDVMWHVPHAGTAVTDSAGTAVTDSAGTAVTDSAGTGH